jgi:hypothetical protein
MPKTKTAERYRWSHPSEWLDDRIRTLTTEEDHDALADIAQSLAGRLDGDSIQDLFQSEMDADGYFQDLNKRAYQCGSCEQYHPVGWTGDCRDDSQRMAELPDDWEEVDEA